MNKICVTILLLLSAISYSQKKIEPGTYLSSDLGQNIKLKLTDDKKYEMIIFYGDYEIQNDTLFLGNKELSKSPDFAVFFSSGNNVTPGKVKVKMSATNALNYSYKLYIATQNGTTTPEFKNIADFRTDSDYNEKDFIFEIDRADFFYLVSKDYNDLAKLEKYKMPRNSNQIEFEYLENSLSKINLRGFFNEKGELVVGEKGRLNLLAFVPESEKSKIKKSDVVPVETKIENNWVASSSENNSQYYAEDEAVAKVSNFKLTVQNSLQKAIEATKKTPSKFLVISYNPDDKKAKAEFERFIRNQEATLGSYISYENNAIDFDKYNYYLATSKDKAWFAKNKITDNPSTIVLDGNGTILGQIKGDLASNYYLFDVYYSSIEESLKQVKALSDLNSAVTKKATEKEILKKMLPLSDQNIGWNLYPAEGVKDTSGYGIVPPPPPPVIRSEKTDVYEEKVEEYSVDSAAVAVTAVDYYEDRNEMIFSKINFDKKKLLSAWEKIVKNHEKDAKPDMDFVAVALSEIQNSGFYSKAFNERRLYDETNFKALDYLLKHYDAIYLQQTKKTDSTTANYEYYNTINYVLPSAITANVNVSESENLTPEYQKRIIDMFKKLRVKQGENSTIDFTYFTILEDFARSGFSENDYVSEYDSFFKTTFKTANEIEILDDLYNKNIEIGNGYSDWFSFKNSYSNISNQVAWFVVEKSNNSENIKKAIKWSESSLRIEKNNAYYLDTLAQLYYKDGQKSKAIATQEQALKYVKDIDQETLNDMQMVLEKMKNGTY